MAKKKILIIDDDAEIRRVLNILFRANNYEATFAADAISGMSAAKKENPDLIVLDIGLPGGDGFVLMERFKNIASLACTPVIVLTGRDAQSTQERALQAGAAAFFQKPPAHDELLAAIRKTLGEPGGGSAEKA